MGSIRRLPGEIIYKILQYSPDIDNLTNAVLAYSAFYEIFMKYEASIASAVLRKEIPHQHYTQALCHFVIINDNHCLPKLADFPTLHPCLASFMKNVRHQCDRAQSLAVSLKSARFISHTEKKVAKICKVLIGDNSLIEWQASLCLGDFVPLPIPSPSERIRVHQAIYLFGLLACLCKNLGVETNDSAVSFDDFRQDLQQNIIEHLMAPWEFCHTIGIRIYLCRALYRLRNEDEMSRVSVQSMLVSGIDVLHWALCVASPLMLGKIGSREEFIVRDGHGLTFTSVLSKALSNSWSRRWNQASHAYRPLWKGDESEINFNAWKKFEIRQFAALGNSPELFDVVKHDTSLLDGSFGLWGAALWDENRWDDIIELLAETSADTHMDPMALGILLVEERAWAQRNGF